MMKLIQLKRDSNRWRGERERREGQVLSDSHNINTDRERGGEQERERGGSKRQREGM
jgi:hypothetical protein